MVLCKRKEGGLGLVCFADAEDAERWLAFSCPMDGGAEYEIATDLPERLLPAIESIDAAGYTEIGGRIFVSGARLLTRCYG